MKKTRIAVPVDVTVNYYYHSRKPDGTRDTSWARPGPTTSGPVYEFVKALVLGNAGTMKNTWKEATPWGYSYAVGGSTPVPGVLYPSTLTDSIKTVSKPSIPSFAKRKADGEIVVSSYTNAQSTWSFVNGSYDDWETAGDKFKGAWGDNNTSPDSGVSPHPIDPNIGQWIGNHFVWSVSWQIYYKTVDRTSDVHPYQVGFPQDIGPSIPVLDIDKRIITATLAEANAGVYDLLTEIAELPSTLGYLAGVVKTSATTIREHKKRVDALRKQLAKVTGKTAEKVARKLASAWLQFRYAIMPLVYSVEDIKETLKSYKRIFAKWKQKDTSDFSFEVSGWDRNGAATSTKRCFIKRSFDPEGLVDQLLGVLNVNPFSTAWELVTLSFVVDWFINIGDAISAFTMEPDFTGEGSCFSEKIDGSFTFTIPGFSGKVECSYDSYRRLAINPRDYISLSFKVDMNWKRWLDAIALGLSPSLKSLKRLRT